MTYSNKEWDEVLGLLRDDTRKLVLLNALSMAKKTEGRSKSTSRGTQRPTKGKKETKRRVYKNVTLGQFDDALRRKVVLGSNASLREFARTIGLPERLSTERDEAVTQIISFLSQMAPEHLHKILASKSTKLRDLGGEYERWVEIILNRTGAGDHARKGRG
ncbi:MAG: hypothetical protein ACLQJR_14825 [Stellaceae bacterium]